MIDDLSVLPRWSWSARVERLKGESTSWLDDMCERDGKLWVGRRRGKGDMMEKDRELEGRPMLNIYIVRSQWE